MSYDVTFGEESFNYTYNVAKFFQDHFPASDRERGLRGLNGLTGAEAVVLLTTTFSNVERTRIRLWENHAVGEPKFCALYDAPNGWGSLLGAIVFLAQILAACAANPEERVTIS